MALPPKVKQIKRHAVWKRSDKKCFYCGKQMVFEGIKKHNKMTIEHLVPLSKGGSWSLGNLRAACLECNEKRGNKSIAEFAGVYKEVEPKTEICECEMPYIKRESAEIYRCVICKKIAVLKTGD